MGILQVMRRIVEFGKNLKERLLNRSVSNTKTGGKMAVSTRNPFLK